MLGIHRLQMHTCFQSRLVGSTRHGLVSQLRAHNARHIGAGNFFGNLGQGQLVTVVCQVGWQVQRQLVQSHWETHLRIKGRHSRHIAFDQGHTSTRQLG